MLPKKAVFVNLFPTGFYYFLLAAVTVVNKAEMPPLTRFWQEEASSISHKFKRSKVSWKEISSNSCLLGIGIPKVFNLQFAFAGALVLSYWDYSTLLKHHWRPFRTAEKPLDLHSPWVHRRISKILLSKQRKAKWASLHIDW